jgi:hypothetical protein
LQNAARLADLEKIGREVEDFVTHLERMCTHGLAEIVEQ